MAVQETTYTNKNNRKFTDNVPVYSETKSPILENTTNLNNGNGEIVELQKRHYGTKDASEALDRSFSELTRTKDNLGAESFFNLYRELFYDIPKVGENSHTTLMLESREYINDYVDPSEDQIQELLERIVELETEKTQFPTEHPIYRNGSFLRIQKSGGPLGLMQEGRLRLIQYKVYRSLRRPLGYVNEKGKPLSDSDIHIIVGSATWNELPKWPVEATITEENPNLNASLSDFLSPSQLGVDLGSLVNISSLIQTSQLRKEDINALMVQLKNKIAITDYGIEGNFDGTFQWDTGDLLPFNFKGNSQGEIRILNLDTNDSTGIGSEIDILFNNFKNRMNGVGLGINSPDFIYIVTNFNQIIDEDPFNVNQTQLTQALEFESSKSQLTNSLQDLANAITNDAKFEQYRWDVDPDKFTNDNNNKFYWVKEDLNKDLFLPQVFNALDQVNNNNDFTYNP